MPSETVIGRSVFSRMVKHGAKHRRLFLNPAAVGQSHPGSGLQRDEVEIASRVDEPDGAVKVRGLKSRTRSRVSGQDEWDPLGDTIQRIDETSEHGVIVDVRRSVHRDESVAPGSRPGLEGRTGLSAFWVGEQGVDHDIANEVDLVVAVALRTKIVDTVRGWSKKSLKRSVTTRLTSSGMLQSRLRSPASTWATLIPSLAATSEHATVLFTSPTTVTTSTSASAKTFSTRSSPWQFDTPAYRSRRPN